MRLIPVLLLAACAPLLPQSDPHALRLQPLPKEEPLPAGPAWKRSIAEAEAEAKQRQVAMLLYFTAKW